MISQVSPGIYRGPRPTLQDAAQLADLRIRIMISLEGKEEDEKEIKEFPAMLVFTLPITFSEIYLTGIGQPYFDYILETINLVAKPVLVHCQYGQDRTGLIIAGYRVKECGWTKAQAEAERNQYGYRWWLNYGLNRTWRGLSYRQR